MPKRKAAVKRLRVDKKRRLRNLRVKNELRKAIKKFNALVSAKNVADAKTTLSKVSSLLDKAAKKQIIHPNTASRRKSRLSIRLGKSA